MEGRSCGCFTTVGNTIYQIIGPPYDNKALSLIAHEASHPRAAEVLGPIVDEIQKRNYLWNVVKQSQTFSYVPNHNWLTYFVDQFIKAMQVACIDFELNGLYTGTAKQVADKRLKFYEGKGWIFTRDFLHEIKQYKEKHSRADLADVGIAILTRLEKYWDEYKDEYF